MTAHVNVHAPALAMPVDAFQASFIGASQVSVGITLGIKEERITEGSLWDHASVGVAGRSNSSSL
jgi:hypothetical protein